MRPLGTQRFVHRGSKTIERQLRFLIAPETIHVKVLTTFAAKMGIRVSLKRAGKKAIMSVVWDSGPNEDVTKYRHVESKNEGMRRSTRGNNKNKQGAATIWRSLLGRIVRE